MDISERYIKFIANYLLKNNLSDITELNRFVSRGILDRVKKISKLNFIKLLIVMPSHY